MNKEKESWDSKCDGCTYWIDGIRRDRKGHEVETSQCLCEAWMCAGCIPTYEFSDAELGINERTKIV